MPNWCANTVTFSHEDPAQIARLVKAFNETGLFNEFVPTPKELQETTAPNDELIEKYGYSDWYSFQANEWGTKWDVRAEDYNRAEYNEGDTEVELSFDTAWSHPAGFYDKLTDQGFTVEAYFYEPGMAFCGTWTSESGEEVYDIQGNSAWVKENIPTDIDDIFAISESMEQWEDE